MGKKLAGVAVFAFCLATAPPAYAQNAQITGTVKDSSGGIHPRRDRYRAERGDRPGAHRP